MDIEGFKIITQVTKFYTHPIGAEAFDKEVKEKVALILNEYAHSDYDPSGLMIWVAKETKSTVSGDSISKEFCFNYVGI